MKVGDLVKVFGEGVGIVCGELRWFESNLIHQSERGGIGRHKTLKMSRPIGLAGSSPAARTKENEE